MFAPAPGDASGRVQVWGAAVRICHWGLAAAVVAAMVQDDGGPLHRWIGYAAAGFVFLRWAAAATRSRGASLAAMVPSWRVTSAYLHALRQGQPPRAQGHDPLGLCMVWLLWALVLALGVTGWMSRLDAFWGDDTVHAVHLWLSNALLAAVLVHLLGVLAMSWVWRENLPLAMVTGSKRPVDPGRCCREEAQRDRR